MKLVTNLLLSIALLQSVAGTPVESIETSTSLEKRSAAVYGSPKPKCHRRKNYVQTASIQDPPAAKPVAAPAPVTHTQSVAPAANPPASSFIQACLDGQNKERARLGVAPLEWDQTLVNNAKIWSSKLAYEEANLYHSSGNGQGENLYWYSASNTLPNDEICRKGIQAFVDERSLYTRQGSPAISEYNYHGFGHYTQLVWKGTQKVGCAVQVAEDKSSYLTCRYFPPGNVIGQKPY